MVNTVIKFGIGLTGAALIASLATPVGREAVNSVGKGIYDTTLHIKTQYNHGEAGVLPYNTTRIMLGNTQTPETLALYFGDSKYVRGVHDLIVMYITAANKLPDTNARIEAGQMVVVPVYDPKNGRRLGDLVDEALSQSSK